MSDYVPLLPPNPPNPPKAPSSPDGAGGVQAQIGVAQGYLATLSKIDNTTYKTLYDFLGISSNDKPNDAIAQNRINRFSRPIDEYADAEDEEDQAKYRLLVKGGLIDTILLNADNRAVYDNSIGLGGVSDTKEKFEKILDKGIKQRADAFTLDVLYAECVALAKKEGFGEKGAKWYVWNYLFKERDIFGCDHQFLGEVAKKVNELSQKIDEAKKDRKKAGEELDEAKEDRKNAKKELDAAKEDRKKAEDELDAAEKERKKAEIEKDAAKKNREKAKTELDEAKEKGKTIIADAGQFVADADNNRKKAVNRMVAAFVTAAVILILAVPISSFCLYQASASAISAATANAELGRYVQTFDERLNAAIAKEMNVLTAATERVDAREAEARETKNTADKALQDALAKQDTADKAFARAVDAQRDADATLVTARNLDATANRKLETATEKENNAKKIEERADATMLAANNAMTEARQTMQAAVKKDADADNKILIATQEANVKIAVADERARMERERRMGVEAMIKAGAPLQFPLEDHERNEDAQNQRSVPSSPVANPAAPQPVYGNPVNTQTRTAKEILREIVWRWCLEKEFGIEDESGELFGEVTGLPRTGYRASLQGCPFYDPEYVSLYDPGYVPPFGVFRRDHTYNSFTPTTATREIAQALWEGKADNSPWWWEEWWALRTQADAKKNELGVPPDHTFSLPRDVLPPHKERLDRRYLLSQMEVTQELWKSVMGNNPSRFRDANRPVENVSWENVQEFVARLNEIKEELGVPSGYEFTLPLDREWEHACRAGTATPFHFGVSMDSTQANKGNPRGGTNTVGMYPPNPWGLHDMHGNVREWCQDGLGYGPFLVEGRTSLVEGFYRSLRGGSWSLSAEVSRSAYRSTGNPTRQHDDVGFRLCLAAQ